ncbi:ribosomal-processing cysteine protease Prp [Sporanaerobium hydrogeniformans]|uniref:Ribosomal-processing cysteine protease Prp n=1 Tax=Sporanaerobium hydrogeniformans TaxID=3072179 RepID=A0AC61DDY2_9FIRM|nr:ribosomal-processing cysteine protease Prp [Sporanaerobium hydrogeniformans]PHV71494.1 ribosomal-processing cysteine protease Prp [Sporanaerobium hydrogeniformans]
MTKVTLYYKDDLLWRFKVDGHAGFAVHGEDIVCAAISMLTINTINAISLYTKEPYTELSMDSKRGLLDIAFPNRKLGRYEEESELLLKSMVLGLKTIQETYGEKYIQIRTK